LELNDYQIDKIATDSDLKKNYLHNRIIADQHSDDLTKKEYYLFSVKQKESYYNNMNENKKLDKAIKFGDLDFYKYLVEEKGAKIGDDAVEKAAETGNLELVTYLVEKGAKIGDDAVEKAAGIRKLDVVKYLVEKGAKIGDDAVEYAAKTGNLELVEYLVKNGAKIGDDAVSGAVRNRKSNVVKYLVRIGAKITDHDAMIDYLKSVEENELIIKQLGLEKD
jgi:ankyrin repeat protein